MWYSKQWLFTVEMRDAKLLFERLHDISFVGDAFIWRKSNFKCHINSLLKIRITRRVYLLIVRHLRIFFSGTVYLMPAVETLCCACFALLAAIYSFAYQCWACPVARNFCRGNMFQHRWVANTYLQHVPWYKLYCQS